MGNAAMDYLNFEKERRHRLVLFTGYGCIALAILIASLILVYESKGYGIAKNGKVIQNGLVYFSSQPNPADIYIDNKLASSRTNTRLTLPGGVYHIKLSRSGYRDWLRTVEVYGGNVLHFDYPLLIPDTLYPKTVHTYTSAPNFITQSPDKRWLVIPEPGSLTNFDLYDTKDITTAPTILTLPGTVVTTATTKQPQSWQVDDWADDNQHLLLTHTYDGKFEFILVDRQNPAASLNLNTTFSTTPTKITFNNRKYNQFYLYNATAQTLQTANLKSPTPVLILQQVLNYQTYSDNTILYATTNTTSGKVEARLTNGNQTYSLHAFDTGSTYLLNLTTYNGSQYVVIGSTAENKVYIYKDPIGQLSSAPGHAVVPIALLHVTAPNYVSFSNNAQFIMAEAGGQIAVYDIQNDLNYGYMLAAPLDTPQLHVAWMDGDRLVYDSSGKQIVLDYDDHNVQSLVPSNAAYQPAFSPSFNMLYAATPAATDGSVGLTSTELLTPSDQ